MRWQVAQMLAYGARGIGYFTYWTPDPDPAIRWQSGIIAHDGTRTSWYDFLLRYNPRVQVAGRALARAHRRRTTHAGSLPRGAHAFAPDDWIADVSGRAAIGEFEEPGGGRLLLVANSDSSSAQAITLRLGERSRVRIVASGEPVTLPFEAGFPGITELTLPLEAGDFALLELTPLGPPTFTLALAPNPASGRVRFALVAPSGSRFEIIDLSGRRVWGRPLDRGITAFEWRGERDDGGTAGPGMYFARLRDGIESAPRRFVWLGSR
jgi:hypothetical protein